MVAQDDQYPEFPPMECAICHDKIQLPRKWLRTPSLGNQIFIDWKAADDLMNIHCKNHMDTLTQEVEDYVRANAR